MVANAGYNAVVSGNIGYAFSDGVLSSQDQSRKTILVTEVSSFQLDSIESFHPHIAVLLNITRDHMDRYASMADYTASKYRITENQTESDYLILNADDPVVAKLAEETQAQVRWISTQREVSEGAFMVDGKIYLREGGESIYFCEAKDIPIPGLHNVQNTLASLASCRALGIERESLLRSVVKFGGVAHRIEPVYRAPNGVRFFNDSKATNVDSLEKALDSFTEPLILVAGGRDKHSAYERLNSLIKDRVKHLILIGEAAPLIRKAWGNLVPTVDASSMDEAVRIAWKHSVPNDTILLSPACSSFDMFKNFEDRGEAFKRSVRSLFNL
jgi:UDP-N-acetylmuramoylalanine--D-glutamate ligase